VIRHPDHVPLITTKLQCPQYQGRMVDRTALVQRHLSTDCQVLLVLAPAGYGKTVFLSQLAQYSGRPPAWYSLDAYDDEPVVFLKHLAATLQKHASLDEVQLHRLLSRTKPEALCRSALGFFISALEALPAGCLLVLDNWHVISHPTIWQFLAELIPLLPKETHLALSGRDSLDLLGRLALEGAYLAGQVQLVGRRDLQFAQEELESFFSLRASPVPKGELARIAALSAGWPITLSFLAQAGGTDLEHSAEVPPALAAYLDREILQVLPGDIQDFLI